jgi:hypothetical protein
VGGKRCPPYQAVVAQSLFDGARVMVQIEDIDALLLTLFLGKFPITTATQRFTI